MSIIDEVSPYCSECQACGEEECCLLLMCKQSEKCDYCEKYLMDMKFGKGIMIKFINHRFRKMLKM